MLDVDYHHGNGTQTCFYERGAGAGEGFNLNLPLPRGTEFEVWRATLQTAMQAVSDFAPQVLVEPLGLDTFEGEPSHNWACPRC